MIAGPRSTKLPQPWDTESGPLRVLAQKVVKPQYLECVCNPWNSRDPFGLFSLLVF